jgi:hypothetical protein
VGLLCIAEAGIIDSRNFGTFSETDGTHRADWARLGDPLFKFSSFPLRGKLVGELSDEITPSELCVHQSSCSEWSDGSFLLRSDDEGRNGQVKNKMKFRNFERVFLLEIWSYFYFCFWIVAGLIRNWWCFLECFW